MTALSRGRQFRDWDRFDYLLSAAALALVIVGLLLIYSGSLHDYEGSVLSFSSPVARQAVFAVIAVGAMLVMARIDYHHLTHYSLVFYVLGIVALLGLLVIGATVLGSTRWFNVGPIQVQPSEFAKLAVILLLARYFGDRGGDARDVSVLGISLLIVAPVAMLVFIQPDLGTTIVFGAIWLGMVLVAGVSRSNLLVLGGVFIAVLPFVWTFAVADYQIERIAVLVDPEEDPLDAGYNPIQVEIAVGSGQFFGKGLTNGEQTQYSFLKVPTKDFIFGVLSEELGFVGAMGLFALFILLLMRGIRAAQLAGDVQGQLIAVGIVVMILTQAVINIAVNLSLFPVTGIPLPFVSQGGSSLVTVFASLGVLQSIIMRHRAYRQN